MELTKEQRKALEIALSEIQSSLEFLHNNKSWLSIKMKNIDETITDLKLSEKEIKKMLE